MNQDNHDLSSGPRPVPSRGARDGSRRNVPDRPDVERTAVRAVILTPESEVLLMKFREPERGREIWLTPGGGLLPGEDSLGGLIREVREETGLTGYEPGPKIWTRRHTFRWAGRWVRQFESFYLIRTRRFEPHGDNMHEQEEREATLAYRWWKPEEMATASDRFAPKRMAALVTRIVESGPPDRPLDVGP